MVAPFLVLAPSAVWAATSADALYAAVAVWSSALLAVGAGARSRARRRLCAVAAGFGFGLLLFSTYGGLPCGLVAVAVAVMAAARRCSRAEDAVPVRGVAQRAATVLGEAAVGLAVVVLAFRMAGFWWLDGFRTTRHFYATGTAQFRPYTYFVVANLAALAIAVGPAVVAGWIRSIEQLGFRVIPNGCKPMPWQRWGGHRVVGAAALAAVLFADLSGFSKGEVERIWLLFMPFLAVSTGSLRHPRRWLGVQLVTALVLQAALRTKW